MRFKFVDRILSFEPRKSMTGIKNVTRGEPFFYLLPNGVRFLSPAIVAEATMQMGSWLIQASTDFKFRPVLLADECTTFSERLIQAGDQIKIEVSIDHWDDEIVHISGTCYVNDKIVLRSDCCRAYLLPLGDFQDPVLVKQEFATLYQKDRKVTEPITDFSSLKTDRSALGAPCKLEFVDELISHTPGSEVSLTRPFSLQDGFFSTHFSRRGVVPGVLMLSCLGEAAQILEWDDVGKRVQRNFLYPLALMNIKFRRFIEPGDQAIINVKKTYDGPGVSEPSMADDQRIRIVKIKGQIKVGTAVAMVGEIAFVPISAPDLCFGVGVPQNKAQEINVGLRV